MNMRLPQQDSAVGRGIKTALQAMVGFAVGLIIAIWAVPGVPHAVVTYVQQNYIQTLLMIGIPSGVSSLIWNLFRKEIPDY